MTGLLITAVVISISDTRSVSDDVSGSRLVELLQAAGLEVREKEIVSDDLEQITEALIKHADSEVVDLIVTTGGTGFSPRDNTPEATRAVMEREAPGLAEAMRRESAAKAPMSMLSRAVCGIRGGVLIVNLPGSPRAVEECFEVISPVIPHAVGLLRGTKEH